jgi:hypothetical protein
MMYILAADVSKEAALAAIVTQEACGFQKYSMWASKRASFMHAGWQANAAASPICV